MEEKIELVKKVYAAIHAAAEIAGRDSREVSKFQASGKGRQRRT